MSAIPAVPRLFWSAPKSGSTWRAGLRSAPAVNPEFPASPRPHRIWQPQSIPTFHLFLRPPYPPTEYLVPAENVDFFCVNRLSPQSQTDFPKRYLFVPSAKILKISYTRWSGPRISGRVWNGYDPSVEDDAGRDAARMAHRKCGQMRNGRTILFSWTDDMVFTRGHESLTTGAVRAS